MDLTEALTGIRKHRQVIHDSNLWGNPARLGEEAVKIVAYMGYVADNLARLHREATDKAGMLYKQNSVNGVTNAQEMARFGSTAEREAYEDAKYVYNAADKLVSTIQTHLRVQSDQMKKEALDD